MAAQKNHLEHFQKVRKSSSTPADFDLIGLMWSYNMNIFKVLHIVLMFN